MSLVLCSRHKQLGNPGQFCFVNDGEKHIDPRSCQCDYVQVEKEDKDRKKEMVWVRWQAAKEDRKLVSFPHLYAKYNVPTEQVVKKRNPYADEQKIAAIIHEFASKKVISTGDYRAEMRKKYGKENPACPIHSKHEPIDPRWWLE